MKPGVVITANVLSRWTSPQSHWRGPTYRLGWVAHVRQKSWVSQWKAETRLNQWKANTKHMKTAVGSLCNKYCKGALGFFLSFFQVEI